jgi:DNA polymerase-3 subunit gamma/tau
VRDSLSVLGQLLAGAGPEGLTYADAVASLGLTDAALIDAFVEALSQGSPAAMFDVVDRVITAGHDPRRFVTDVLERLRDLVILRADPQALASGLVDVPDDAGERMLAQAESLGLAELSRAADLVSVGLGELKGATAPRLQLELLCARLALPGGDDLASLLARIERLERGVPGAPPAPVSTRAPVGTPPAAPPTVPAAEPRPRAQGEARTDDPAPAAPPASQEPSAVAARPPAGAPPRRPQLRSTEVVGGSPPAAPSGEAPAPPAQPRVEPAPAAGPPTRATGGPGEVPPRPGGDGGTAGLARVRDAWAQVLARLAADSRVAWTAFAAAVPVSLTGGTLAVAVGEAGTVRAIAQRGHDERLRQALIDVLGLDVTVDVLHDPGAATGSGAGAGAPAPGSPAGAASAPAQARPSAPAGDRSPGGGPDQPSSGGAPADPPSAPPAATRRGAGLVRAAAQAGANGEAEQPDQPSDDDPDLSSTDGVALLTRELGARPVGEIDHS